MKDKTPGKLIGTCGECLVMAELLKRGIISTQTAQNFPYFDIVATDGKKFCNIRVKTKRSYDDHWQWCVKKDGRTIFQNIGKRDFAVLVDLKENAPPEFFILKTEVLDKLLKKDFRAWLKKPGVEGKQHDPKNTKRDSSA